MALLNLVQLLRPFPLKVVVDTLTTAGGPGPAAVTTALLAAAAALALQGAITFLQTYDNRVQSGLVSGIIGSLREEGYARVLAVPLRQQAHRGLGEILHRLLRDAESVWDLIMFGILPIMQATAFLLGMAGVMLWIDPWLGLVALAVTPPLFVVTRRSYGRITLDTNNARAAEGVLYDQAQQTLSQRLAVAAFALETREFARFRAANRDALDRIVTAYRSHIAHSARADLVLACGGSVVLVLGVQRVLMHRIGIGDLVLFVSYLAMLYQPLSQLSLGVGRIANARAGLNRLAELVSDAAPLPEGAVELAPERVRGHLRLEGVHFAYGADRPVLTGLDLEVLPGEKIALVGGSGAGKTTLMSLLLRLDDPDAGRIVLDGTDLREARVAPLRRCMALVHQPPFAFSGTIRDNLLLGNMTDVEESALAEAIEYAHFGPVLARLPAGLEQDIGERGQLLSEGERQRLAIARVLLRRAPVVLLDEPTSALDPGSEECVVAGLRRALAGRTTILVSHRPAPLCLADRILVLAKGRIVEEGTFSELTARSRFFRSQLKEDENRSGSTLLLGPFPTVVPPAAIPGGEVGVGGPPGRIQG